MSRRAVHRLGQLLAIERAALLAGDLAAVQDLAVEKETLAQGFDDANRGELAALSGALARNGVLLAAAQDGVSLVLSTLRKQREARQTLSSYDSSGKATTISRPPRNTERRF